jgi:hypothetical protein
VEGKWDYSFHFWNCTCIFQIFYHKQNVCHSLKQNDFVPSHQPTLPLPVTIWPLSTLLPFYLPLLKLMCPLSQDLLNSRHWGCGWGHDRAPSHSPHSYFLRDHLDIIANDLIQDLHLHLLVFTTLSHLLYNCPLSFFLCSTCPLPPVVSPFLSCFTGNIPRGGVLSAFACFPAAGDRRPYPDSESESLGLGRVDPSSCLGCWGWWWMWMLMVV